MFSSSGIPARFTRRGLIVFVVAIALLAAIASSASASLAGPRVLSTAPRVADAGGGTEVVIRGYGYSSGVTAVRFGGVDAEEYAVDSDNQITAVAPAGPVGHADVTVTTIAATSPTDSRDLIDFATAAPSQLSLDAASENRAALRWTQTSDSTVSGYRIYRDGSVIGSTGPHITSFVDTGLEAGETYSYTVGAVVESGETDASSPLSVTTAASAIAIDSCSLLPLAPGNYKVTADLVANGSPCLQINDVSGVTIDCQGHSIDSAPETYVSTIRTEDANHFLVADCTLPGTGSAGFKGGALSINDSSDGTAFANTVGREAAPWEPNNLIAAGSTRISFDGNTAVNSGIYFYETSYSSQVDNTSAIRGDTITPASGYYVLNGHNNVAAQNSFDGNAPSSGEFVGADDGILLGDESNSIIEDNSFTRLFDAGVETLGFVSNSEIVRNTISHAEIDGIGAYSAYETSWFSVNASDNEVTQTPMIFRIETGYNLPTGEENTYFAFNSIERNSLSEPALHIDPNWAPSSTFYLQQSGGSAPLLLDGNSVLDNDFGTAVGHPNFSPVDMQGIDFSGNVCHRPKPGGTPVICDGDRPGVPVVTSLSQNSGTVLGGDPLTIHGENFTDATWVRFESHIPYGYNSPEVPRCGAQWAPAGPCFEIDSDTQISLFVPAMQMSYNVDVTVSNERGYSHESPADVFLYYTPPAPSVEIAAPVSEGWVTSDPFDAQFSVVDNGGGIASVDCVVQDLTAGTDLMPDQDCSAPSFEISGLTEGHTYRLTVQARDHLNQGGFRQVNFHVDLTPPALTVDSPYEGQTFNASQLDQNRMITVDNTHDSSATSVVCVFDSDPPVDCPGSLGRVNTSDGDHTVTVTATDEAGNATTVVRHFSVDTVAPDTSLTSGPTNGAYVHSEPVDLTLASNESGVTYECALDGSVNFYPCSQNNSVTFGSQGQHTFAARAIDGAGNVDATPASVSFTLDTIAPALTISSPANGTTTSATTLNVSYAASDASAYTVECSLDASTYASCPATIGPLAAGQHALSARATDAAGNVTTAVSSFTIMNPESRELTRLDPPSATEDLTAQGTLDWSHWGTSSASSWDHKAGGASISNLSAVGSTGFSRLTSGVQPSVKWSDGTPTASNGGTSTGLTNSSSGNGRGFGFTIANVQNADPVTLRLALGAIFCSGRLELYWSSNPGDIVSDATLSSGSIFTASNAVFQATLVPPIPNDTLNVRWTQATNPLSGISKVRIYSASLSEVAAFRDSAPATADLTAGVDVLDWEHWGGATAPSTSLTPIGKSGATLLSGASQENGGALSQASASSNPVVTGYTWTDGDSVASAASIHTGLANTGGATGRGFSITAPAAASARTLRLYVGATNTSSSSGQPGELDLYWNGSAVPVVSDVPPSFSAATNNYVYTITLRNAAAGTLKAKWATASSSSSHKVTLQSAVLGGT